MNIAEYKKLTNPVKANKYRNVKTEIDGYKFDSKKEAKWYLTYKQWQLSGQLTFTMQDRFDFVINKVKIGFYKCDFTLRWNDGRVQIIDCKGMKTPVYQLKKKLMKAIHNIEIIEL